LPISFTAIAAKRPTSLEVELAEALDLLGALGRRERGERFTRLPSPGDGGGELVV
jgi:hypothetical protein